MLTDDPTKRTIYTDAHTSGMVPHWRDMAAIITTKTALIEAPPPESLAALGPWAAAVDWGKMFSNNLIIPFYDMAVFADVWAAIERRWADGDYSVRAAGPSTAGIPFPCGVLACCVLGLPAGDAADRRQPCYARLLYQRDPGRQNDGEGARAAGRIKWPLGRRDVGKSFAGRWRRRCGGRRGHDLGLTARPRRSLFGNECWSAST